MLRCFACGIVFFRRFNIGIKNWIFLIIGKIDMSFSLYISFEFEKRYIAYLDSTRLINHSLIIYIIFD